MPAVPDTMQSAIRILQEKTATTIEEWAQLVRSGSSDGINQTFSEARAGLILDLIGAIRKLKS